MIRFAPVPGEMRSRLRNAERPDADLQTQQNGQMRQLP